MYTGSRGTRTSATLLLLLLLLLLLPRRLTRAPSQPLVPLAAHTHTRPYSPVIDESLACTAARNPTYGIQVAWCVVSD
jgi:hypothetical protein